MTGARGGDAQTPGPAPEPAAEREPAEPAGAEPELFPRPPTGLKEPAHPFPIVAIGCSAGGLAPLRRLVGSFQPGCGLAFVAIQHLDPTSESHMTDLLASVTNLGVATIQDGMRVEPDRVYVLPPNHYVTLTDHELRLVEPQLSRGRRMPIDHFLHSLAEVQQERCICVLLSGSGDDGTSGARSVREYGGLVIVQDPQESDYPDMPSHAAATGVVDYVLPVERMSETIQRYAERSFLRTVELPPIDGDAINSILAHVMARTRYDFRGYKRNTLVRRIHRRMGLSTLESPDMYLEYLRQNPAEAELLRNDLLIGVTSFFREAESWDELRRIALHEMIAEASPEATLRAWVPGCSTGEEAYSLAIIMLEEMESQRRVMPMQIFASDIDEAALETARHGVYPADTLADVPEPLRERYFVREGSRYRCERRIREPVIFSVQNLISDPPFSRLDLVSCRNLLIYLEQEMQRKVSAALAFALRPSGWLFLGKSDSIPGREDLFRLVSKRHRIYRRLATARPDLHDFPTPVPRAHYRQPGYRLTGNRPLDLSALSQQATLRHFNACVLLVDLRGKILHFAGDATRFLTLPAGEPDLDLLVMAREKLSLKLRPALNRASEGEIARIEQVEIDHNGQNFFARATLLPLAVHNRQERLVVAILEEVPQASPRPEATAGEDEGLLRTLEGEIRTLKEELQGTYEEFETSNEELKAANEEVMSMNEEMQSANEELETSKEEMQSINEELTTVNNQLNEKVLALSSANDDLANLFNATQVAIVILDDQLRIRRFTPRATELLNLIETDVGRPLAHISQTFDHTHVIGRARKVLAELIPIEEEVGTPHGDWFTMRIFPYRTTDNRIDGVVITFSDVTRLRQVQAYAEIALDLTPEPLVVMDPRLQIIESNAAFRNEFGLKAASLRGRPLGEVDGPGFARIQTRLAEHLAGGGAKPFTLEGVEWHGAGSLRVAVEPKPLHGPALLISVRCLDKPG